MASVRLHQPSKRCVVMPPQIVLNCISISCCSPTSLHFKGKYCSFHSTAFICFYLPFTLDIRMFRDSGAVFSTIIVAENLIENHQTSLKHHDYWKYTRILSHHVASKLNSKLNIAFLLKTTVVIVMVIEIVGASLPSVCPSMLYVKTGIHSYL